MEMEIRRLRTSVDWRNVTSGGVCRGSRANDSHEMVFKGVRSSIRFSYSITFDCAKLNLSGVLLKTVQLLITIITAPLSVEAIPLS